MRVLQHRDGLHTPHARSVVRALAQHGADVNQAQKRGDTPLHVAAANGSVSRVDTMPPALINSLARSRTLTHTAHGQTHMFAYFSGDDDVVRALVGEFGASGAVGLFARWLRRCAVPWRSTLHYPIPQQRSHTHTHAHARTRTRPLQSM